MNTKEVLAVLVCLSFAFNLGDWLLLRQSRFIFAPRAGWLRNVFAGWSIFLGILAALALASIISTVWLIVTGALWMICSQTGAILARHNERRVAS